MHIEVEKEFKGNEKEVEKESQINKRRRGSSAKGTEEKESGKEDEFPRRLHLHRFSPSAGD